MGRACTKEWQILAREVVVLQSHISKIYAIFILADIQALGLYHQNPNPFLDIHLAK